MAAVHSSCRLCNATRIREQEEKSPEFKRLPCKCTRGSETVYHLDGDLTLEALKSAVLTKFKSLRHEPISRKEGPANLKGGGELRVHGIYPLGLTQRQALYNFKFQGNSSLSAHKKPLCQIRSRHCVNSIHTRFVWKTKVYFCDTCFEYSF